MHILRYKTNSTAVGGLTVFLEFSLQRFRPADYLNLLAGTSSVTAWRGVWRHSSVLRGCLLFERHID